MSKKLKRFGKFNIITIVIISAIILFAKAAEAIHVKHLGDINLNKYSCALTDSSFVESICWNNDIQPSVIVSLNGAWYGYCNVPHILILSWLNATSKGSFYNSEIKGSFGC